jgi:hypothetical protein
VLDRIRRGAIAILVAYIILAAACMVFALVEGRHQPLWLLAVPVLVWAIVRQASGLRRIFQGTYGDRTGRHDQEL